MSPQNDKRDSRALEPELRSDPNLKAEAEARNGLRQYDAGIKSIQAALALQLLLWEKSESMGNHDSEVVDASSVD